MIAKNTVDYVKVQNVQMRSHGAILPDPIVVLRWHRKIVKSFVACVEVISKYKSSMWIFLNSSKYIIETRIDYFKTFHYAGRKTSMLNYFTRSTLFTRVPTHILDSTQRSGNPAGRGVKY